MPDNHSSVRQIDSDYKWAGWGTLTFILIVIALLTLTGCWERSALAAKGTLANRSLTIYESPNLSVITDPETGCQYLKLHNTDYGGLTPRMLANGQQLCPLEDLK